jgi:hypothetical protein
VIACVVVVVAADVIELDETTITMKMIANVVVAAVDVVGLDEPTIAMKKTRSIVVVVVILLLVVLAVVRMERTWSSNQQKSLEAKAATLCQLIDDQGLFEKNKNNPDQREFMGYELINHMILSGVCDTRREGVKFGKDLSKRMNLFDHVDDDDTNKNNTFSDDMKVYKLRGVFKSILTISENIDEDWRTDQDKVER